MCNLATDFVNFMQMNYDAVKLSEAGHARAALTTPTRDKFGVTLVTRALLI